MGPSGAGKTTLLDVLAGRKASKNCSGSLVVDDLSYQSMASRRSAFGYVLQDDSTLPSFLTVREAIEFSANLRLPPSTTPGHRDAMVDQVIQQLGLERWQSPLLGKLVAREFRAGKGVE